MDRLTMREMVKCTPHLWHYLKLRAHSLPQLLTKRLVQNCMILASLMITLRHYVGYFVQFYCLSCPLGFGIYIDSFLRLVMTGSQTFLLHILTQGIQDLLLSLHYFLGQELHSTSSLSIETYKWVSCESLQQKIIAKLVNSKVNFMHKN